MKKKEKPAFTLQSGKFEFNIIPFGLTNAVATFCALMDRIFADCQWDYVLYYIDDILVFTPNNFNLHLTQLESVFIMIDKANMKLKLSKCEFVKSQVEFLGHLLSREGLKMDPRKIDSIKKIVYPKTKKRCQRFPRHDWILSQFYP